MYFQSKSYPNDKSKINRPDFLATYISNGGGVEHHSSGNSSIWKIARERQRTERARINAGRDIKVAKINARKDLLVGIFSFAPAVGTAILGFGQLIYSFKAASGNPGGGGDGYGMGGGNYRGNTRASINHTDQLVNTALTTGNWGPVRAKIASLESNVASIGADINNNKGKIKDKKDQIDDNRTKINGLDKEIKTELPNKKEAAKKALGELDQSIKALNAKIEAGGTPEEVSKLKTQLAALEKNKTEKEQEIDNIDKLIKQKKEDQDKFKDSIDRLEKEIKNIEDAQEELAEQKQILQDKINNTNRLMSTAIGNENKEEKAEKKNDNSATA